MPSRNEVYQSGASGKRPSPAAISALIALIAPGLMFVGVAPAFAGPQRTNAINAERIVRPISARESRGSPQSILPGAYSVGRLSSQAQPSYLLCNKGIFGFGNDRGVGGSDVWGWRAPDGTEYAIMGTLDGVAIVDALALTVTSQVSIPVGACSFYWRDIKTYRNFCYIVSDCGNATQGITVLDLSFLPDSAKFIGDFPIGDGGVPWSHNLSIDTARGFLYAEGLETGSGGHSVYIHSLANPGVPVYVSRFGPQEIHDLFVRNDTAYLAEGNGGSFSIWNVTNKISPTLTARVLIPNGGYCHNIWPTDDGRHVITTEELPFGRTVKIWNIENLGNIQMVGEYLGPNLSPHNAHADGDKLYLSHYEGGVRVVDISNPSNPNEIGFFDTYPSADSAGFNGCWGVYPHTQSGLVYASNMDGLLFIFEELMFEPADTLVGQDGVGSPGGEAVVEVVATNSLAVRQFVIPFVWAGPFDMLLDSASIAGCRTEDFENFSLISTDPFNRRAAYSILGSLTDPTVTVDQGTGPILKLYFSIPPEASGFSNPVTITAHSGQSPAFGTACLFTLNPVTVSGVVTLGCCQFPGDANSDGKVNIADVTFLIALIFAGGEPPACQDQADANGDNKTNIADVTFLIARIFASGSSPVCGARGF